MSAAARFTRASDVFRYQEPQEHFAPRIRRLFPDPFLRLKVGISAELHLHLWEELKCRLRKSKKRRATKTS